MARSDFRTPRLFVASDLAVGRAVPLEREAAHYLTNVLRLEEGAAVLAFNGRDGEWRCALAAAGRKAFALVPAERTREQTPRPRLIHAFAPLKQARLDYLVQKAVEMGAGLIQPVLTRHTQVHRLNLDRLHANVIEAAEQCGIIAPPLVREPVDLADFLAGLPSETLLVFCDEEADVADPVAALARHAPAPDIAVLIGPEGGFAEAERAAIRARPRSARLSLGPRILRADTAAVAAMALTQAVLGDGRG